LPASGRAIASSGGPQQYKPSTVDRATWTDSIAGGAYTCPMSSRPGISSVAVGHHAHRGGQRNVTRFERREQHVLDGGQWRKITLADGPLPRGAIGRGQLERHVFSFIAAYSQ
jgi:hypothetical protein